MLNDDDRYGNRSSMSLSIAGLLAASEDMKGRKDELLHPEPDRILLPVGYDGAVIVMSAYLLRRRLSWRVLRRGIGAALEMIRAWHNPHYSVWWYEWRDNWWQENHARLSRPEFKRLCMRKYKSENYR